MSRKLAIKKLRSSDLSFFQEYLIKHPQTKQKGFNLDRKILEHALFPSLEAEIDAMPGKRAPVALTFHGPGGAEPYTLMRKVLKNQKNWRLNGEAVHSPDNDPKRFDKIAPEDIAIMEFSGTSIPSAVKVVLLSATHPNDKATHAAFKAAFPGQVMSVLTEKDIELAINAANTPIDHPIRDWIGKELLEDVVNGDPDAIEQLLVTRKGRGITVDELNKAKATAEKVGRLGEELLNYHLESTYSIAIKAHEWVANVNPLSPFDFKVTLDNGTQRHIDAKSTGSVFGSSLFLSTGELKHALNSGVPYDIYRLYNVSESSAKMRVSRDIAIKLAPISKILNTLPIGVKVDSLSFNPEYFDFDPVEIKIEFPEDPE